MGLPIIIQDCLEPIFHYSLASHCKIVVAPLETCMPVGVGCPLLENFDYEELISCDLSLIFTFLIAEKRVGDVCPHRSVWGRVLWKRAFSVLCPNSSSTPRVKGTTKLCPLLPKGGSVDPRPKQIYEELSCNLSSIFRVNFKAYQLDK